MTRLLYLWCEEKANAEEKTRWSVIRQYLRLRDANAKYVEVNSEIELNKKKTELVKAGWKVSKSHQEADSQGASLTIWEND